MRRLLFRAALAVSGFAITIATCAAQISSTVTLSNGVELRVDSSLGAPTGQQTLSVEMSRATGNSFYRLFRDQNHLAVFAYELVVDLVGSGDRLRVLAKPCEQRCASRFPGADGGKPVPTLGSEQQAGVLASGQSAEIPLFQLEGVGLKVIDTARMRLDAPQNEGSGRITLEGVHVSVNGAPVAGAAPSAVSGRYAMFYIPGRGGFFLSAQQPQGAGATPFVKSGTINANRMQFTVDNDNYQVTASSPMLANPDSGEVWIYHDSSYQPAGNWTQDLRHGAGTGDAATQFFVAASDSLDWWLKR